MVETTSILKQTKPLEYSSCIGSDIAVYANKELPKHLEQVRKAAKSNSMLRQNTDLGMTSKRAAYQPKGRRTIKLGIKKVNYTGETYNGLAHGQGNFVTSDGSKYNCIC